MTTSGQTYRAQPGSCDHAVQHYSTAPALSPALLRCPIKNSWFELVIVDKPIILAFGRQRQEKHKFKARWWDCKNNSKALGCHYRPSKQAVARPASSSEEAPGELSTPLSTPSLPPYCCLLVCVFIQFHIFKATSPSLDLTWFWVLSPVFKNLCHHCGSGWLAPLSASQPSFQANNDGFIIHLQLYFIITMTTKVVTFRK